MGQSISLPRHKLHERKTQHARLNESQSSNASQRRSSSMGGRLRSFAAALHTTSPSPKSSSNSVRSFASIAPSPVLNDVISARRHSRPTLLSTATDDFYDMLASAAALEQAVVATANSPRSSQLSAPPTPSSLASSFASSFASSSVFARSSVSTTAAAAALSASTGFKIPTDRISSSSSATVVSGRTISALKVTKANSNSTIANSRTNSNKALRGLVPMQQRLRRFELEQIFTAIVTSDDKRGRTKLSLASD